MFSNECWISTRELITGNFVQILHSSEQLNFAAARKCFITHPGTCIIPATRISAPIIVAVIKRCFLSPIFPHISRGYPSIYLREHRRSSSLVSLRSSVSLRLSSLYRPSPSYLQLSLYAQPSHLISLLRDVSTALIEDEYIWAGKSEFNVWLLNFQWFYRCVDAKSELIRSL